MGDLSIERVAAGALGAVIQDRFAALADRNSPTLRVAGVVASHEELLPALNELLEAERAGSRVTLRTAAEAPEALKALIVASHRDEARWCGVLTRAIHHLGGTPSPKTGAFHDKTTAIVDIPARLAFLNRSQGWVVRKLRMLLPTILDDAIHADLTAMLASHERNIGLVAAKLPAPPSQGGSR
ncbi:MAG TPA: DUF6306 domain-containing protein [Stellaceae bacterium]|nr:DUF6306 domain-containing protein [Stellaceae bacterium]